ncbi:chorismate mutase [Paenibacillus antarcticus]|uniref:Chorismate mutase domain-containing protein n=1 Tax=Paenibacillus antarcticus TaxID=253703 RepID=A0A168MXW9_9BACL|nr:chorismate mutase [Paenibacillus antarcticus]OAB45173.1 hypothetical protein PBAT_14650 [Paenibacillus antarcticus]
MNQEKLTIQREEIDRIDRQIVALLAERTQVVKNIMVLKKMKIPYAPLIESNRYWIRWQNLRRRMV